MSAPQSTRVPRCPASTYRLQLHRGFGFAEARACLELLSRLGVTDVYTSPLLRARPGSTHGYDTCDPRELNPELGSAEDWCSFDADRRRRGLGLVLDFVPNHMGADAKQNPWWRDVLENGRASRYARFFDVDWHPPKPELEGRVLLAVLGASYGEVLERGELRLGVEEGALVIRYFEQEWPIDPRPGARFWRAVEARLAGHGGDAADRRTLDEAVTLLERLPASSSSEAADVERRRLEKEEARDRLGRLAERSAGVRRATQEELAAWNGEPGQPRSFDRLHELLEAQPYRLAHWRTAADEVNYRRFFDIGELAALRMEDPAVFEETHALVLRLVREDAVTGLRLDHIDGLLDPRGYLERLRTAAGPLYVVAEKILTGDERLAESWQLDGTSGYDFLNDVNDVLVDRRSRGRLQRIYERFIGSRVSFAEIVYESKRHILRTTMASELATLAAALSRISEHDRRTRDFTLASLRRALAEVVACFPVYRTYVDRRAASEADGRTIDLAVAEAKRRSQGLDPSVFEFIASVLQPHRPGPPASEDALAARIEFATRFQQYTAPIQAKGVEDTAFYRYNVLVSLNEVGGDPGRFGRSLAEFHQANARRRRRWPHAMLATATHDTKRGEDARARLAVLAEMPGGWSRAVRHWARINAGARTVLGSGFAPDRNDEYLFYQTLVAAWPSEGPEGADDELVRRLDEYMRKAVREAKLHTSWIRPQPEYEEAVSRFVRRTLTGADSRSFLTLFVPLAREVARAGMVNSLAQLVLKVASPGVPDFYRGTELWDLSLVDPDNRGRVDIERRQRLLDQIDPWIPQSSGADSPATVAALRDLLERWPDGRVKLFVTAAGLRFRRERPELFLEGDYRPLRAGGAWRRHVIAFARRHSAATVIAIAPRLPWRLAGGGLPVGDGVWRDAALELGDDLGAVYRNLVSGESIDAGGGRLELARALRYCPVALLAST